MKRGELGFLILNAVALLTLVIILLFTLQPYINSTATGSVTGGTNFTVGNENTSNAFVNGSSFALGHGNVVSGSEILFNGLNWTDTTNLVLWWKMNEGAGNATRDYSGSGYHGILRNGTSGSTGVTCNWDSLVGCAKWSPGFVGNASLSFNELPLNTSFVMVNLSRYNESVTNEFTWTGWINVRNYSNVLPRIWSKTTHYMTIQNTGGNQHMGRLVFETQNATGNASDFYATGGLNFSQGQNRDTWIYVAFSYNGSNPQIRETGNAISLVAQFYINGQPVNTTFVTQCTGCTNPGLLASTFNRNFTVGGASLREFNGSSMNVKVFNRTLTAAEVLLDYNSVQDFMLLNNPSNYSMNYLTGVMTATDVNTSVFGSRLYSNYSYTTYFGVGSVSGLENYPVAQFLISQAPVFVLLVVVAGFVWFILTTQGA